VRKRRVLVHGLVYFGQMFAELMDGDGWDFRYYPDQGASNLAQMARELAECDLVYQIGGRVSLGPFLRAAHTLRKSKIVMHWVGSDTFEQQQELVEGKSHAWVMGGIQHWAESNWMVREVEALGLECQLIPLPSARVPTRPSPLPEEFSVLVYMPVVDRGELYGLDRILSASRALPHIRFVLVGLYDGTIENAPPNLEIHGRISDLAEFYRRATVVWRPVRHDGLSFMVMEAMGHGRHVMWTYPFPGCIRVDDAEDAIRAIEQLHDAHKSGTLEINHEAVAAIADGGYLPVELRTRIRTRLEELIEA
jgi:Glycosyl transferases group 1